MMDRDCLSCKEIHELLYIRDGQNLHRSNQLDLADEIGGRIVCKNKHIVYNGMDIK
jgi:hypothetical protein